MKHYGMSDDWLVASRSLPPHRSEVHVVSNALVQSSSGIVAIEDHGRVLEDTLDHTSASYDGYRRCPHESREEGSIVYLREPDASLKGKFLSLLMGGFGNHYHWSIMNLSRLSLLRREECTDLNGILVPSGLGSIQMEQLGILGVGNIAPLITVAVGRALQIESLLLPWNAVSGSGLSIDESVIRFWKEAMQDSTTGQRSGASMVYIDRRKSGTRTLTNEGELVESLQRYGFTPVCLEEMSFSDQARIFSGARIIVAPHGAGLANLIFAKDRTRVIELMPSGAVNWCYRQIALACGHDYDCIMGESLPLGRVAAIWQPWRVSIAHVVGAVVG